MTPRLLFVAVFLGLWVSASAQDPTPIRKGPSGHWAFQAPAAPKIPRVERAGWNKNPLDAFVLAELSKRGLDPSPEADGLTLARRVHLDLIGLPPTEQELEVFLADARPDAWHRLVDRLLASPHYGEHWARQWLDLARYADTNGYEKDRPRNHWPWRDWVIDALNRDLPFDRFTILQIAGDLLPNATLEDRIATGFHRNTMVNEEGGIDVAEFRFEALVDRVNTTGATWLGLTLSCAQCHDHKYDPITQREYYEVMAFLDNVDDVELPVPDPAKDRERRDIDDEIARLEAGLEQAFSRNFPNAGTFRSAPAVATTSSGGATLTVRKDGSVLASGVNADTDTFTVELHTGERPVGAVRLVALPDPSLPSGGPGRTRHGNFVLSRIRIRAAPLGSPTEATDVPIASAEADFAQPGFPVEDALRDAPGSGWAIHGPGIWNVRREATFLLARPIRFPSGTRWTISLDQLYGGRHTLGAFQFQLAEAVLADDEVSARTPVDEAFEIWLAATSAAAVPWTVLVPDVVTSENNASLSVLPDGSVLAHGDKPDRDRTIAEVISPLDVVTAIRLEALPHESLPALGSGRSPFFPEGGFVLSELKVEEVSVGEGGVSVLRLGVPTASAEPKDHAVAKALDGALDTAWTNDGHVGKELRAVFPLAEPLRNARGVRIRITMDQHHIHQTTLGRWRLSVTGAPGVIEASFLPAALEAAAVRSKSGRSDADDSDLRRHFLLTTPRLAHVHRQLDALRRRRPRLPTTLVVQEREPRFTRTTRIHRRGEFLSPGDAVTAGVPGVLHALRGDVPRNRLALARWLVDPRNPLVARVTVNRDVAAIFGRGLVETLEDFGTRGVACSHPDLLDWLAVRFMADGWSKKELHRLIVTSATYRQRSESTEALFEADPTNRFFARGPRFRLDAEVLRDQALTVSGLLARTIGGPSIFPPQPEGVTSLSYGGFEWRTSKGPDRYRRALYTYRKRTAPFAVDGLFDAPSGEVSCPRRSRTNTPLQALVLMNDPLTIEAARALASMASAREGGAEERLAFLFQRCLGRPWDTPEREVLVAFLRRQVTRLEAGELAPRELLGSGSEMTKDVTARAALYLAARVLLNLDEMVTKP